jgi:hypothetical protein
MTIENCTKILIAKEKCMERETSGIDAECNLHNCDDCSLCYEQGTMGEQKEALKFAVETMRKYQKIQEIVTKWKADTWTDGVSYDCMKQITEVIEENE